MLRSPVQPGDDSHGDLGSRTGVGRKPEQSFVHHRPGRGAALFIRLEDATPGMVAGFNPQQRTGSMEAPSRYKGMSCCATRYVEWSPDREASPGQTFAYLDA